MALFSSSDDSTSETVEIWNRFSGKDDLKRIIDQSNDCPQLIYKHSHRCSVCIMAKEEIEGVSDKIGRRVDLHFLNVVNQREISDHIASELDVRHESPQVIILRDGEVAWTGSHWEIKGKDLVEISDRD